MTYGVGCTQVEVDCITGDVIVLSADIVMDVGKSINPAIGKHILFYKLKLHNEFFTPLTCHYI